jgi:hypothetical protein
MPRQTIANPVRQGIPKQRRRDAGNQVRTSLNLP